MPRSRDPQTINISVNSDSVKGAVKAGRMSMPGLLILCLFLPWTLISCGGKEMASQSGVQVLTGSMSVQMEGDLGAAMKQDGGSQTSDKLETDYAMWVYLVGLVIVCLGALRALAGHASEASLMQNIGGGVMLAVLVFFLVLGMSVERKINDAMKDATNSAPADAGGSDLFGDMGAAMGKLTISATKSHGFYVSLLGVVGLLGVGGFEHLMGGPQKPAPAGRRRKKRRRPIPRPSQAGEVEEDEAEHEESEEAYDDEA